MNIRLPDEGFSSQANTVVVAPGSLPRALVQIIAVAVVLSLYCYLNSAIYTPCPHRVAILSPAFILHSVRMLSLSTFVPLFIASAYGLSASTKLGCFDNSDTLRNMGEYLYNTQGYCESKCSDAGYSIAALQDANCWCGDDASTTGQLANDACDTPCPGYAMQTCGGDSAWTYLEIGAPSGKKSSTTSSTSDVSTSTPVASSSMETSLPFSSAAPASSATLVSSAVLNSTAVVAATSNTPATTGTPAASSTPTTYTGAADRFLASFNGVLKSLFATAFAAALL